jgi:hypothetical protein
MKLKLKCRRFDSNEEIQAEWQRVLDADRKGFSRSVQKWRRLWYRGLHAGVTTSRVMAADRSYGNFYDFYSVSPEYFGYFLVFGWKANNIKSTRTKMFHI